MYNNVTENSLGDMKLKTLKRVSILVGVALILAPFVLGYRDNDRALWASLVLGVVIGVLGHFDQFKINTVVGLVVGFIPWELGFEGETAALWMCLLLGLATTLLNGYVGFFKQEEFESAEQQQRHASMK